VLAQCERPSRARVLLKDMKYDTFWDTDLRTLAADDA